MVSKIALALTCVSISLVCVFPAYRPAWAEEPAKKSLPRLGNTPEDVTGTIADSTRGKEGPVRLVLNVAGGRELAALVALDEVCEALGLSLRKGEEVTLRGQMVATGERPLFVTEAVVVDGAPIAVRDPAGGWAKVGPTAEARARAAAESARDDAGGREEGATEEGATEAAKAP